MRRLTVFGLALMSALAVGVAMASAAFAESTPLPDIHTALPGELYPIWLGGHLAGEHTLRNATGAILKAKEVSVLLQASELTSLGAASVEFLKVELGETKCRTLGDSEEAGAVLIPGAEYHLVYTGLSGFAEQLEVADVLSFDKFTIFCAANAIEIITTGPATQRISLTTGGAEGDATDIAIASKCISLTSGIQEIPYYYEEFLQRVSTTLLANVSGTGNAPFCELIEGTLLLTPETGSAATMFTILS